MTPTIEDLYDVIEATWPPAGVHAAGPWVLRDGAGGGQRVSAATVDAPFGPEDLPAAEDAMRMMGQNPIFMIRDGDDALDQALAERGYQIKDPVNLYLAPIETLTDRVVPPVTAFVIWEPLEIMREIWEEGGIGPDRIAVMERCRCPKTAIFGRIDEKPGGTGYCAVQNDVAMVHALEVRPPRRGRGLGRWMMRAAAIWAANDAGATWMSVLCTQANDAANGLYSSLGMTVVGQYHYRVPGTAKG